MHFVTTAAADRVWWMMILEVEQMVMNNDGDNNGDNDGGNL